MEERKGKKQGEREKTDRVVLIGKSKEDVKIWSREVGWLKGNLVQRQMSLSLFFSLPVPSQYSIEGIGFRDRLFRL